MKFFIRPALSLFILLNLITGLLYPAFVTTLGQLLFPATANGSFVIINNQMIGSSLIGQQFTKPEYFWGRPSATLPTPYNAAASSGSNLGPSNPELIEVARKRAVLLQFADPNNRQPIPLELLASSASGLDPHISLAAAVYQAERIARVRNLESTVVHKLISQYTEGPELGFLGATRINVLQLNAALDLLQQP